MKLDAIKNPAIRAQATRLVSRDLGRGNGETVKPTLKPKAIETWFRTSNHDARIHPVEVIKINEKTLLIRTNTGAEDTVQRKDPAVSYHPTRAEAIQAVREHLDKAVLDANTERRKFLIRETLIA